MSFQGEVFEEYDIRITFPPDYPYSLPKVYETSNKISHEPDMHFNPPDWHACLFVSHQRWEIWPVGSSFKRFLEIPVHNFFLGQAHFAAIGYWPDRRERGHGNSGIVEYYQEKFEHEKIEVVYEFLQSTRHQFIPRQKRCPCGSGLRMRECHGTKIAELRKHQEPGLLDEAVRIFSDLLDDRN